VLPSGIAAAALAGLVVAAGALAMVKPLAAVAAGAAALALTAWMGLGLYRAAALVATITQYVMVTRPGCSAGEPKDERVVKVVKPQSAVLDDAEEAVAPAEPVAPATIEAA
jgi:hypothetical protein